MKIKPCPFCELSGFAGLVTASDQQQYKVKCRVCGTEGPSAEAEDKAIDLWNNAPIKVHYRILREDDSTFYERRAFALKAFVLGFIVVALAAYISVLHFKLADAEERAQGIPHMITLPSPLVAPWVEAVDPPERIEP